MVPCPHRQKEVNCHSQLPLIERRVLCVPSYTVQGVRGGVAALLVFCSSSAFLSLNSDPNYYLLFPPRLEGFFKFS